MTGDQPIRNVITYHCNADCHSYKRRLHFDDASVRLNLTGTGYHSIHLPHNDNTIASLVSGAADEVLPVSVYTVMFLFIAGILFIFYSFISLNFTLNLFRFRYKKKLDTG